MNKIFSETDDEFVLIMYVHVIKVVLLNELPKEIREVFAVQLEPTEVSNIDEQFRIWLRMQLLSPFLNENVNIKYFNKLVITYLEIHPCAGEDRVCKVCVPTP